MTSSSIGSMRSLSDSVTQSLSDSVSANSVTNNKHGPARANSPADTEDKVDFSTDSKSGLLASANEPDEQSMSWSNANTSTKQSQYDSQQAHAAEVTAEDKVELSTTAQARLLRSEGESVSEIANVLNVPAKTVEQALHIKNDIDAQSADVPTTAVPGTSVAVAVNPAP